MIIRKSNPIPVRQDGAEGIPPALGVENCSAGSSAPAAFPLGSGRNLHNSPARESLIASERGNPFSNDAPDQPGTLVFIEFGRSGIAAPFQFYSFIHDGLNSQGGQQDHVAQ